MSVSETIFGLLLAATIGLLTRGATRRQGCQVVEPPREVDDTPPAIVPLLGVVPPPRAELPLDDKIIQP